MNVFLVEDSPLILDRLAAMLEAIPGVKIVGSARDARAAIAGIRGARPDVVLADLKLTHGTGFDVLSEIHGREPGIDFYMLSSFASEPYRRCAERLGSRGFLDKTSEFGRVREVISQRPATQH